MSNAQQRFDIELSFRPEAPDGVLLFIADDPSRTGSDFIAFGLLGGHVEFRMNLGDGAIVVYVAKPIDMHKWHAVRVHRNKKQAIVSVDERLPLHGQSRRKLVGLDLDSRLYLGGFGAKTGARAGATGVGADADGFRQGFSGCLSRLLIDGQALNLRCERRTDYA